MVGKSKIKLIKGLAKKKQRHKNELFVVEGIKSIEELLSSALELEMLYTLKGHFSCPEEKLVIVSEHELKQMSNLTTPQTALAVFKIPQPKKRKATGLTLALDGVRDPGNLGTIIRLCDWFGVLDLVCSEDCVDCYNPKVIQASMGSIARVNCTYTNLENYLKESKRPIFGAFMDGKNVYNETLPKEAILVLGNEANGVSSPIESVITQKLAIPQFGNLRPTESLNVATAGAILLSEFRR